MSGQQLPDDRRSRGAELRLERVGDARTTRRRPAIALVALLVFIGLAVAKPWGAPAGKPSDPLAGGPATAPPVGSPLPVRSSTAATDVGVEPADWAVHPPFIPGPRPVVSEASVRSVLRARDGWGVRAVIETGAGSGAGASSLAERWTVVQPDGWGEPGPIGDQPVRALGISAPAGTMVIDVRVLIQVAGQEHWLDAEPVAGGNPGSTALLWPPRSAAGWEPAWPSGNYRFLVLTAAGITVLGAVLPGSGLGPWAPSPVGLWLGSAEGRQMSLDPDLSPGLFAGVIPRVNSRGLASPPPSSLTAAAPRRWAGPPSLLTLGGRTTAALGTASAWLDTLAGQPSSIAAHGVTAWLPTAVAIGVAGPANMAVHGARLVRLMPGSGTGTLGADNLTRPIVDLLSNRPYREAIRFEEPDGRAWEPGVYAVFVEGNGIAGSDVFAYVLTLLPGSARQIAAPLAASRAWARFAGGWGVAAGLAEPIDSPGRLAIRFSAQGLEPVIAGGADFTQRCLSVNLADSAQAILGISHPYDVQLDAITLQRVYTDESVMQPLPAQARSVLPGLSLVGPGEGNTWAPGWYRLLVTEDGVTRALPVCVGEMSDGRLAVPPGVGTRGS